VSTDSKPGWCPQDLWDETSSAFDLLYESEPAFKFGFEYEIRSMAAAVAMVAIATERERAARVCEQQAHAFLSPEYTADQPLGSFEERFACASCADAIRATPNQTGEVDRT
jgi:hypothetical protein